MRKVIVTLATLTITIAPFSGCAVPGTAQNHTLEQQAEASCPFFSKRMLQGAAAGAAIGGATAAATSKSGSASDILKGVFGGAVAGGSIGKILDTKDCEAARLGMQRMATTAVGKPVAWRNPESGNGGTYVAKSVPTPNASGQLCRSYHQTVTLRDGTSKEYDGTTCRDENGDWRPVG